MQRRFRRSAALRAFAALAAGSGLPAPMLAGAQAQLPLNTGKKITLPLLGSAVQVGNMPCNLTVSPDGKWAVSTSTGNQEYLSVINASTGKLVSQVAANGGADPLTGLYYGLAFAPAADNSGNFTLFAALGGAAGVAVLKLSPAGVLTLDRIIPSAQQPHNLNLPGPLAALNVVSPSGDFPSGLATDSANRLYVANNTATAFINGVISTGAPASLFNEQIGAHTYLNFIFPHGSLSIVDPATGHELGRYNFFTDLASGFGGANPALYAGFAALPFPSTPNGYGLFNYPLTVAAVKDGSKCYVGSQRDDAVYVLNTANPAAITLAKTLPTGSHPVAMAFNKAQTTLYVANANGDTVSVIDVASDAVTATISLRPAGAKSLPGVSPVGLALSPDEKTLYAALGDMNALAVINTATQALTAYIPTGWYPSSVAAVGNNLLVSNAKGSVVRHPNPLFQTQIDPEPANFDPNGSDHVSLIGNIQTFPAPSAVDLLKDTVKVMANNGITATTDHPTNNPLAAIGLQSAAAQHLKHVIYIIKENRTFDQVLGDLGADVPGVNADPSIVLFDKTVTPNLHALSKRFVTLDNFFNAGEVSSDGWTWCTGSFANESVQKNVPYNYSNRGRQDDSTGQSNGYIVGGHPAKDVDGKQLSSLFPPQVFPFGAPPIKDIAQAPGGHIWDLVRAKGLSYRNYGFFVSVGAPPLLPDNYPVVPGVQPEGHDLAGITDYDFRQFDLNYADSDAPSNYGMPAPTATYGKHNAKSRFSEWNIEFQEMIAKAQADGANTPLDKYVPAFMTVRLMRDHTNGFGAGNGTPKALVADNDYSVGQLVQTISQVPDVWNSTAIFVIEDDSQDGPDHIDCHRSTAYVISPWIKQNSLDHSFYNTDSVLKTMELLMGLPSLSQYDAIAPYITDWDVAPNNNAPFVAIEPAQSIINNWVAKNIGPKDKYYRLAKQTEKLDLKHTDAADPRILNEIIWKSVKGMDSQMPAPKHLLGVTPTQPANGQTKGKAAVAHHDDDDDN
jgi:YVTN family beta-propeller protein